MGKFNFISGGFYGKVGNTVGQRFRNKRIMHAYVVPSNPRTETQQTNRLDFADCTGATQLAIQLNGGSFLWRSSDNTDFNNRMSAARQYALNGGALYSYVPVIPYGYEPPHYFEPSPSYEEGVITWQSLDPSDLGGREMAVALRLRNRTTDKLVNVIRRGTVSGTPENWSFSVPVGNDFRIDPASWQVGVSADDDGAGRECIYIPAMSIANLKQKISVALTGVSVSWDSTAQEYKATVSTSPALQSSAQPLLSVSLSGILQAETSQQNTVIQAVTSAGSLAFSFTPNKDALNQRVLFPAGSTCTVSAATFQSDEYIYTVPTTALTFSAALETQDCTCSASWNVSGVYANLTIQLPTNAASIVTKPITSIEYYVEQNGYAELLQTDLENVTVAGTSIKAEYQIYGYTALLGTADKSAIIFKNGAPTFTAAGVPYQIALQDKKLLTERLIYPGTEIATRYYSETENELALINSATPVSSDATADIKLSYASNSTIEIKFRDGTTQTYPFNSSTFSIFEDEDPETGFKAALISIKTSVLDIQASNIRSFTLKNVQCRMIFETSNENYYFGTSGEFVYTNVIASPQ